MMIKFLVLLVVLMALSASLAQQSEDEQQRTVQLTREMVEALLQVLSPTCRVEMEGALGSQSEISDECKFEIQRTLATFQQNGQQQDIPEVENEPASSRSKPKQQTVKEVPASGVSPVVYITGFVIAFFAGIAGLVVYINKKRGDTGPKKVKKLSKKKVSVVTYNK